MAHVSTLERAGLPAADDAGETRRTARRSGTWQWLALRWPAVATALIAIPIAVITAAGTLYWPGRVFPGFFVMGNALVPTIGLYDWTGMARDVPFHSRVVAVDDRPVVSGADVYDYVAALSPGHVVRYTLVKDGATITRDVPAMRFTPRDYWLTVGLYIVFGLVSVGAGIAVALLQPHTRTARVFLGQSLVIALFAFTGTACYEPNLWSLSSVHVLTQAVFPATFIHLGWVFPVERPFVVRNPRWLALPYAIGTALTLWIWHEFYAVPPGTTSLYAAYLYSALAIVVLMGLAAFAYWENRLPGVRHRIRTVLIGLVVGTGLALYGFLNISRAGGDFPMNLIALGGMLFYLSIAYAIARHDLFDIDRLVKQAATYATATLAITATYAASLVVLGLLLPPSAVRGSPTFNIAFVILIAICFEPLRSGVQHLLNRTFYRSRPDFRRTVSEVSAALTTLLDFDEILARVGRAVTDGIQVESFTVIMWSGGETKAWRYDPDAHRMVDTRQHAFDALRRVVARASFGVWHADEEPTDPERMRAAEEARTLHAELVVALTLGDRVTGALALGPKRSGRPFGREDRAVLDTLADQTAIAIENAISYHALATLNRELETKIEARTAELRVANTGLEASNNELSRALHELRAAQAQLVQSEKMASLGFLVAGVAHEINNPVTFIAGTVRPIRRHLDRLRAHAAAHPDAELTRTIDRLTEMFDVVERGAERTAGIVNDLKTFSRPGEALPKPMDVHEGIEVSLRLLRPRWDTRVEIHREYGSLPELEAAPSQINQVIMNILSNAFDAIRDRGNVWIRTTSEGGWVRIAVRDDGTGIAPEHLDRIFDPFFTTKDVGKGTGLGLAISHRIIDDHAGTLSVTSTPGRGTEFTISLPIKAVATAS